ncbi:ChrR family anti-sigma-E factor [Teichococcus coralli]|uniref:ChrR family anti-sigma-E factor n=1 Tax=Teichococcus coralli TaxID=2545983 RepID=UPI003462EBD0
MNGAADGTIRHHPSEETLVSYAVGGLGPAAGIAVKAHLLYCRHCRATTALAVAAGGLLLLDLPPSPLAPGALQQTLDRLGGTKAAQMRETPAQPARLRPPGAAAALSWLGLPAPRLRWVSPGVRVAVLLRESGGAQGGKALLLLRVRPGVALPTHGHAGTERTCVLEGAFADEGGRYGIGDLAEAEGGYNHRPVAEGPADCVCLIATSGRTHFAGTLGKLVGAWLKI